MATLSNEGTDERSQAIIAGIEAIQPKYILELPSNLKARSSSTFWRRRV
jgi:hypothetical protein